MPKKPSANRKLCKICNVWIADNKIQRLQHEEASKHKQARAALLKSIADKNERKAKEQKRDAALAADKIAPATGGTNAAAVTQQLLEKVASASSRRAASEKSRKRRRDDSHGGSSDIKTDARSPENGQLQVEALDENGFPLPASAMYGQWQSAEAEISEQGADSAHLYWGEANGPSQENNDEDNGDLPNQEQPNVETVDESVSKSTIDEGKGEENSFGVAFKRRPGRRTKRVRQRTSTL